MKKISIFHQFDPRGCRVGGIGNYLISLMTEAEGVEFSLIGVTSEDEKLFQWKKIEVGGKTINFLPLARIKNENSKSFIPVTLKYLLGLFISRFYYEYKGNLFFQRIEYALPFLYFSKNISQYCIVHNDLEIQLDRSKSEYTWSNAPKLYYFIFGWLSSNLKSVFSVNTNSISVLQKKTNIAKSKLLFTPTWANPKKFYAMPKPERIAYANKLKNKFNLSSNTNFSLFVGRFQKQKNIIRLLEIFETLPENHILLLAGTGNLVQEITNAVDAMNLDKRVIFLGNIPHSELNVYLNASDSFVSTSHFEGMSVALLEAIQVGLPVVTTGSGESKNIIAPGINGYVCDDSNLYFSKLIVKACSMSYEERLICSRSIPEYSADNAVSILLNNIFKDV